MKIQVKIKQEHLVALAANGSVCITVDDAVIAESSDFVLRPVIELVRGEDVDFADLVEEEVEFGDLGKGPL